MRLYVCGPMSGIPHHNFPAFERAARALEEAGYEVVNPAELDEPGHIPGTWPWEDYLRRDLLKLLACEGVATLPAAIASKGARLEMHVARELKMPVHRVEDWITAAREDAALEMGG